MRAGQSRTNKEQDVLSVIIPTLNAAATLPATLAALGEAADDIVVVDGGSDDATVACARAGGARVIAAGRGRGGQLAAGIPAARGDWLLLLHADTRLEAGWAAAASVFMAEEALTAEEAGKAGYFRFALDSAAPQARRLERAVAWRSRVLGLPYGDQGLLLRRALLDAVGGVRALPLMEDVDLARRLGRARLVGLAPAAVTSAVRWEREGWTRRSARNVCCLGLYFAGVPPARIALLYAGGKMKR
jgi:rSAM/selenodomain-associated transferase 2